MFSNCYARFCYGSFLFLLLICSTLAIFSLRPGKNWQLEMLTSASMAPALPAGSLVLVHHQPPWSYQVGDVVTFRAPVSPPISVTHRIVRLYQSETGVTLATTRGDANNTNDPWALSLGSIDGQARYHIANVGFLLVWLRTPFGFSLLCAVLFVLLVAGELIYLSQWLRTLNTYS